jgi:hypothetical protein
MPARIFRLACLVPLMAVLLAGCAPAPEAAPDRWSQPRNARVHILRTEAGFQMMRDGKPFFIKGAVGERYLDELQAAGGNSIRVYTTDGLDTLLDQAHARGIAVMVGLYMMPARYGFDYNNQALVQLQMDSIRRQVLRYKDHPAVLFWGLGNELELHNSEPSVWVAINETAKMIHQTDPDHPVAAVILASERSFAGIREYCPDLDLLAVNSFSSIAQITEQLKSGKTGWDGPYVFTEWGNRGAWEAEKTHWDAPIERTTSIKAAENQEQYERYILPHTDRCLGSYVFLWGQKQERTHTWHSMFSEDGHPTNLVDMMTYLWSGKWPENRAPEIDSLTVNGKNAFNKVYLHAGKPYTAAVFARDPEQDTLQVRWEILPEGDYRHITGGDREERPEAIAGLFEPGQGRQLSFRAPGKPGAYRVFVYVRDSKGREASANVPFFVTYPEFRSFYLAGGPAQP